ncbi:MAG: G5 domain-containing protein [Actinomycetota bacterium]|nr:G5 domain-containing protein [Actinomycetota bacterium]
MRFLKTHYIIAALIPALIIILSVTGFVWAQKGVTVMVDGTSSFYKTQSDDVAGVLDQAEIVVSDGDVVTPALGAQVEDGMVVVVRHAIPVTVVISGEATEVNVIGLTVADALVAVGADPSGGLVVEPAIDAPLEEDMTIRASEMFVRMVEERRDIPFETTSRNDATVAQGTRTVETPGVEGSELLVYEVVVLDGVEGERTLKAQAVVDEPVDEVVVIGTKRATGHTAVSRDTNEWRTALCSWYGPGFYGKSTASGVTLTEDSMIVAHRSLPFGTRVELSYGGRTMIAEVQDRGPYASGRTFDLGPGTAKALGFSGVRSLSYRVLDN